MYNSKAQDGEKEEQKTKGKHKKKTELLWLQTLISRKHVVKFESFSIKYTTDEYLFIFIPTEKAPQPPFS